MHPDFPLTFALLVSAASLLLWVAAPGVGVADRGPKVGDHDCGDNRHSHASREGVIFCRAMRGMT